MLFNIRYKTVCPKAFLPRIHAVSGFGWLYKRGQKSFMSSRYGTLGPFCGWWLLWKVWERIPNCPFQVMLLNGRGEQRIMRPVRASHCMCSTWKLCQSALTRPSHSKVFLVVSFPEMNNLLFRVIHLLYKHLLRTYYMLGPI